MAYLPVNMDDIFSHPTVVDVNSVAVNLLILFHQPKSSMKDKAYNWLVHFQNSVKNFQISVSKLS